MSQKKRQSAVSSFFLLILSLHVTIFLIGVRPMKIFAHRGASGTRPENTLPSFAEAIRAGAEGIELDVQLTKDNELVVMHDEQVNRTTNGKGAIKDKTLAEIKALNAGSWFDEKYASTKVPTLKEVTDLLIARNYRGIVEIELKTNVEDYPGIEEKVSDLMLSQEWPFIYWYSSFNLDTLERIHKLEPKTRIDLVMKDSEEATNMAMDRSYIKGIHPSLDWALAHDAEVPNYPIDVRPWTVNDEENLKKVMDLQVSGAFTDFPEEIQLAKRRNQQKT